MSVMTHICMISTPLIKRLLTVVDSQISTDNLTILGQNKKQSLFPVAGQKT